MNRRRKRGQPALAGSRAVLLAAVLTILGGCAAVLTPPVTPTAPGKRWDPAAIVETITQRNREFRSLRSLARVEYSGPEGRNGFQEAVVIQRPYRLRLETVTMLGVALIVTVNDKEIVGYYPREGLFLRGKRTQENLLRYTKIPLELEEITMLFMGLPPVEGKLQWREEGNGLVFSANGQKKEFLAFESEQPVPTRWERFDGTGAVTLSARFSEYKSTAQGLFPSRIFIEAPPQGKKLDIRYQEPELNAALPANLFFQEKPVHAQELPIEALGG